MLVVISQVQDAAAWYPVSTEKSGALAYLVWCLAQRHIRTVATAAKLNCWLLCCTAVVRAPAEVCTDLNHPLCSCCWLCVQVWGWRSTFICLTVAAGVIVFPMLMLVVPETHQVGAAHIECMVLMSPLVVCPAA
jgi:hypothetical protein